MGSNVQLARQIICEILDISNRPPPNTMVAKLVQRLQPYSGTDGESL